MNVKQGKSKATEAEFRGNGYKNNSWSKDAEYCKKKKKNGEEDVKVAVKTLSGEGGLKKTVEWNRNREDRRVVMTVQLELLVGWL